MEGALCDICAGLDLNTAVEHLVSQEGSEASDSIRVESPWHNTLADVASSSSSCALCTAILKGWQASREAVVEQAVRDAMFDPQDPPLGLHDPVSQIAAYRDASGVALEVVRREREADDGRRNRFGLFLQVQCGPAVRSSFDVLDPVMAELRIARDGRDHIASKAVDAVMSDQINLHMDVLANADPLSQESVGVARGWLATCVNTHGSTCNPPAEADNGWMPTRLLEVVPGSDKIYLRLQDSPTLTSSPDKRYIALSHCWGQSGTPFTTTHATLPSRINGINIHTLPQTFQDAVTLTKRLGLRYLWIDSLCIIQDSPADWAREAARMANIYRNAHLVLNASNSPADTLGFLCPRNHPDTIHLPPPSQGGQQPLHLHLHLRLLPPAAHRWSAPTGLDTLTNEPISSRAWCLQERSLPRRALQYASHQIFWECERMRASEDGDAVLQVGGGGSLNRLCKTAGAATSVFARGQDREPGGGRERVVSWADWYAMVEDYTARGITKQTDRLPALAGLAQAVARETGGGYLAGVWKSGLLEGLVWCRSREAGEGLAVTTEYVAPSWSWASVSGPVQFPVYSWYERRAHWKAKMADFEPLAEYLGHEAVKKDGDDFGRLQGGFLTLKAPLLPVLAVRPRPAVAPTLHSLFGQGPGRSEVADVVVQVKAGDGRLWVEGGFDIPGTAVDPAELFVVFLTRLPHVLEEGFVEHRFGLLVQRLGKGRWYRRVGFADGVMLKKSIFDAVRGRGMFSIVGYPRPSKEGDLDEDTRVNDLAIDPLLLSRVEVVIS